MTRRDRWKRRPCVVRYFAWRDELRLRAGRLPKANRVTSLSWCATFAPPKWLSKARRAAMLGKIHRQMPDIDNIYKAILDGLFPRSKGGDSGIGFGIVSKVWGEADSLRIVIEYEEG
jgi:Holliday junction resolvase RusA-like endonuclease